MLRNSHPDNDLAQLIDHKPSPKVSIIIVCYNMSREVPRTVISYLPPYQRGIGPEDIEIIVLENGSSRPIPEDVRATWPNCVRYIDIPDPQPSPAAALNFGVEMARAPIVCPVIDGARMASPGLVATALKATAYSEMTFAASVGYHLGPDMQQISVNSGYCQEVEDSLLEAICWPSDGYRLFDICAPGGSSRSAWFGTLSESNAPFLRKNLYLSVGGYDIRFDLPGGGLVNLDFLNRFAERPDIDFMLLMGEATFHQFHGGVTTSRDIALPEEDGETTWSKYAKQYEQIRGGPYQQSQRMPILFGAFRASVAPIAFRGLQHVIEHEKTDPAAQQSLFSPV